MDRFFTQTTCDRCGGSLSGGRIMSMLNTDCLCLVCKEKETKQEDYGEAVEAERQAVKREDYHFKGIRG